MIRLLKWLFTGDAHLHKWRVLKEGELIRTKDGSFAGFYYVLQCEHCGDIKFKEG